MACTIDVTVGGTSANSYCSIADANTYHDTHPYPDVWTDALDDDKCRALQTATRLLDQWYQWDGMVADADQRLLWPRIGVTGAHGYLLPSDSLPERLEQATAELARLLLASDRTAESDVAAQGITSLKAGSVELAFSGQAVPRVIPDAVAAFVGLFGKEASRSGGTVTLKRG